MVDTDTLAKPAYVRVQCSPEIYKQFKLAAIQADMSKREAMDTAFKLFAMTVLESLKQGDSK